MWLPEQWIILVSMVGNLEKVAFDTERNARDFAVGHAGENRHDDWLSMPLTAPADEEEEEDGRWAGVRSLVHPEIGCGLRPAIHVLGTPARRSGQPDSFPPARLGGAAAIPVLSHQPGEVSQVRLIGPPRVGRVHWETFRPAWFCAGTATGSM